MNVIQELRTFTDNAHSKTLDMLQAVEDLDIGFKDREQVAKELDLAARQLGGMADTIKDLAYRLKRGEGRKIGVVS